MPVIFSTPTSHRVFMFDKDAAFMLKAMETSGNIPGALYPEAVVDALAALEKRLQLDSNTEDEADNSKKNDDDYVGVNTIALPLIELMQRAIKSDEKLLWDKG